MALVDRDAYYAGSLFKATYPDPILLGMIIEW